MSSKNNGHLASIITQHHSELLSGWVDRMLSRMVRRDNAAEADIRQQAIRFLPLLAKSIESDPSANIELAAWEETRQLLTEISQARARQGFTSIETANFVFSLKTPLFAYLRTVLADNPQALVEETTKTSSLFDDLGLFTVEIYQKSREQVIIRQTNHMARLVDDLLDVSRITHGKIALRQEPVELKTFLDAAIEIAGPLVQARRHTLNLNPSAAPLWTHGDPVRLAQVFGNLLHNAAKFTPPGGTIEVDFDRAGDEVRISVTDNGIGIPAESLGSIFDLFAQAGHPLDRVQDGLGIGLSLVKSLVELHGGSITAASPGLGQGSRFEVTLPRLEPIPLVGTLPPAPAARRVGSHRILVVDDNQDAAETLAALLGFEGHCVQTCFDGAQGIVSASAFQPDIVFLDIGLPDMSGCEVAVRMRQLPGMADVTLIALTGYGQDADGLRIAQAGFDRHVVKPMDLSMLGEVMRFAESRRLSMTR